MHLFPKHTISLILIAALGLGGMMVPGCLSSDAAAPEKVVSNARLRSLETRKLPTTSPGAFVDDLKAQGYNVLTTGAMYGTGYALFNNDILPLHPRADSNWLPAVIQACRAQDVKVNLWMCFNIQDVHRDKRQFIIDSLYPDYTLKFLDGPYAALPAQTGMCMIASPYLAEYTQLVREVAALGSEGIWFDGFYLSGLPGRGKPGCVCGYCQEKFKASTGLELPRRVDWGDLTFKKWVRWRNERMFEVAEALTEEIHRINPACEVSFNTNTWPFLTKDWESGVPLWKTDKFGVSQHAFYFEPNMRWLMLGYKAKLAHDMHPAHSDIWQWSINRFNTGDRGRDSAMHRLYMLLHNYAGLTYGTSPWRAGADSAIGAEINAAMAPAEAWFQTDPIRQVGVLVSQNTHDFWGHAPGTDNLNIYRNSILGTWLLLTEHHVPFEFIFDNQLETDNLLDFQTLILPNAACLSQQQLKKLKHYAASGGQLIFTQYAAQWDEWGEKPLHASDFMLKHTYFPLDPGTRYLSDRSDAIALELVSAIQTKSDFPVQVDAPPYVATNIFRGEADGKLYIHLLNVRSLYDTQGTYGFTGLGQAFQAPSDYMPTEYIDTDITLTFGEQVVSRTCLPDNENITLSDSQTVRIARMGLHQMICVDLTQH